ncbi:MAG: hypothetical protein AVDCRST_MAG01-01-214, partial [uncultured Rubrobacteraceae bacterium]
GSYSLGREPGLLQVAQAQRTGRVQDLPRQRGDGL